MSTLSIRNFQLEDFGRVNALWLEAGLSLRPGDDAGSIALKLSRDPELFLVAQEGEELVGTVMGAFDGRRGWVYHLAVHPAGRRQGIGRRLIAELELRLQALGCLKVNLLVDPEDLSAIAFYRDSGYLASGYLLMGKSLSDGPESPQRPAPAPEESPSHR